MLALVYLTAFASLGVQIVALVGRDGILPAADVMPLAADWAAQNGVGWRRYLLVPTLGWVDTSDAGLQLQCLAGVALSGLLLAGRAPTACLIGSWGLYLSLSTFCREFLSFQWDALLLETGLLATFLAAPVRTGGWDALERPSGLMIWLVWWLLFRLMFGSGVVKLASGDPAWHSLTALSYHYETQPLPTALAWYVHQAPAWCDRIWCGAMFAIELGTPVLIFAARRWRLVAC